MLANFVGMTAPFSGGVWSQLAGALSQDAREPTPKNEGVGHPNELKDKNRSRKLSTFPTTKRGAPAGRAKKRRTSRAALKAATLPLNRADHRGTAALKAAALRLNRADRRGTAALKAAALRLNRADRRGTAALKAAALRLNRADRRGTAALKAAALRLNRADRRGTAALKAAALRLNRSGRRVRGVTAFCALGTLGDGALGFEGGQNALRGEGNFAQANSGRVEDGVGDGGRNNDDGPFGGPSGGQFRPVDELNLDVGNLLETDHRIGGPIGVLHASFVELHFFEQGAADALHDISFDLILDAVGIDN